MSGDYRLPVTFEDGEQPDGALVSYMTDRYGRRWGVRSFDLKQDPYDLNRYADSMYFVQSTQWELRVGLVEILPEPDPPKSPRKWSSHMGLRRPR